jgi:hypothetical protein
MALPWLPIKYRCQYKLLLYTFKVLTERAPVYLQELLTIHVPTRWPFEVSDIFFLPPLASSRVCFFKFLLIYSKPCLVQLPRPKYWMVKPQEFRTSIVFIGGAVTFTLGPCCSLLRRIRDKNNRCAFTRGSRGEDIDRGV